MNNVAEQLKNITKSEVGDFFSGLEQPGAPVSAKEMNEILLARIDSIWDSIDFEDLIDSEVSVQARSITFDLLEARKLIENLQQSLASGDLEKSKALIAEHINNQVPF